jgi:hypothetical protein
LEPAQNRAEFLEELQLAATKLSIEDRRAIALWAVNLENVFGQIEPDGANMLHGTVPPIVAFEQRAR